MPNTPLLKSLVIVSIILSSYACFTLVYRANEFNNAVALAHEAAEVCSQMQPLIEENARLGRQIDGLNMAGIQCVKALNEARQANSELAQHLVAVVQYAKNLQEMLEANNIPVPEFAPPKPAPTTQPQKPVMPHKTQKKLLPVNTIGLQRCIRGDTNCFQK